MLDHFRHIEQIVAAGRRQCGLRNGTVLCADGATATSKHKGQARELEGVADALDEPLTDSSLENAQTSGSARTVDWWRYPTTSSSRGT